MMNKRLEQQMAFILEADKLKNINRQTYICDGSRKENDAEHSYHLALMAAILSEYANEKVDVLKVMTMVLVHDMIEIDAGDTYAYDTEGNKSKREREVKAADRLFTLLPADQAKYFRGLWDEFEKRETKESKFANTLDRIQPAILNDMAGGKSWEEHDVTISQILGRNSETHTGSEELWQYTKEEHIMKNVSDNNQKRAIINDQSK